MSTVRRLGRPGTIEELLALPDDVRAELIDGQIVEKASPSAEHSYSQGTLLVFLGEPFGRSGGDRPGGWWILPECDVLFEPKQVYRPDLAGWRRHRVPERPTGRPVTVAPDWVCEVLSPSNATTDITIKTRTYHRNGVRHYWVVDPDREVLSVHRWTPDGYLVVIQADRAETVRAEPFDAVELPIGILFGDPW